MGAQRERVLTDRILAPLAWLIPRDEVDADAWLRVLGAVVGAPPEDGGGGRLADLDPVGLGAPIAHDGEVIDELRVQIGFLRGKEGDERVVRRQRDRGLHRGAIGSGAKARVSL